MWNCVFCQPKSDTLEPDEEERNLDVGKADEGNTGGGGNNLQTEQDTPTNIVDEDENQVEGVETSATTPPTGEGNDAQDQDDSKGEDWHGHPEKQPATAEGNDAQDQDDSKEEDDDQQDRYYPAKIIKRYKNDTYDVQFESGEKEMKVERSKIQEPKDTDKEKKKEKLLKKGTHVKVQKKYYYSGKLDSKGRPKGFGYKIYTNYNRYDGQFLDGEFHGLGQFTWKEQHRNDEGELGPVMTKGTLICDWDRGRIKHNKGTYKWPDGTVYEGEFRLSKAGALFPHTTGKELGTLTTPAGTVYKGQWKKGLRHGNGREEWSQTNYYEGQYKQNQKHGKGEYHHNRISYKGHFIQDKKDTTKSGVEAELSNGKERYKGHFQDDERHGSGICTYKDGRIYEGDYKQGHREGHGKLTWPDGRTFSGEWYNDKFEKGVYRDADGNEEKNPNWDEHGTKKTKGMAFERRDLATLTLQETWLLIHRIGFSDHAENLVSRNVKGEDLSACTEEDLQEWGIKDEEQKKELFKKIELLKKHKVNMKYISRKTKASNAARINVEHQERDNEFSRSILHSHNPEQAPHLEAEDWNSDV